MPVAREGGRKDSRLIHGIGVDGKRAAGCSRGADRRRSPRRCPQTPARCGPYQYAVRLSAFGKPGRGMREAETSATRRGRQAAPAPVGLEADIAVLATRIWNGCEGSHQREDRLRRGCEGSHRCDDWLCRGCEGSHRCEERLRRGCKGSHRCDDWLRRGCEGSHRCEERLRRGCEGSHQRDDGLCSG